MCLYPKMIKNPKYLPNKKNNNNPPEITDERVKWVTIGVGIVWNVESRKNENGKSE